MSILTLARPLKSKSFALALTGAAITGGVLVAKWRAAKRRSAIATEHEQFEELLSSLPAESVKKFLSEYELLAAFDGSERFAWKRDLCRKEMAIRGTS
jgi:hypothetical protein